jgi:IclR family transcriptional regulator, acetate operon repressor
VPLLSIIESFSYFKVDNSVATPNNYSVIKAFAILRAFRDTEGWLSGCELSRRANLPLASGYRLIRTMEKIGVIAKGKRGQYRPGILLLSISGGVRLLDLLQAAGEPVLSHVAKALEVTVHLAVLEGGSVSCIGKYASPTASPLHTRVGTRLPACSSGLGKVLLAGLNRSEVETLIMDGRLVAPARFTATTSLRLHEELEVARCRGFATDDRESNAKTRCIAVPIQDNHGRTIAAISASDETSRMTPSREVKISLALFEAAARMQNTLYRSGSPENGEGRRAAKKRAKSGAAEKRNTLPLREPGLGLEHCLAAQSD